MSGSVHHPKHDNLDRLQALHDPVVLPVWVIQQILASELWVAFGTGKYLWYLIAHSIAGAVSKEEAKALAVFHSFIGVPQFLHSNGKETRLIVRHGKLHEDATCAFLLCQVLNHI